MFGNGAGADVFLRLREILSRLQIFIDIGNVAFVRLNMGEEFAVEIVPRMRLDALLDVAEDIKPAEVAEKVEEPAKPDNTSKPDDTTKPEDTSTSSEYIVERGDTLWKLAREYYGLKKPAEIQRTVDYLASVNGMGEGTAANHLKIGQSLRLPDSPVVPEDTKHLNWEAIDTETKKNSLRGKFAAAVNNELPEAQPARVADIAYNGPSMTPV